MKEVYEIDFTNRFFDKGIRTQSINAFNLMTLEMML